MPLNFPVIAKAVFKDHAYNTGWTESMYILQQETLEDALTQFYSLMLLRSRLLGAGITIDYMTTSQDDPTLLGDVASNNGIPWQTSTTLGLPYYNPFFSDFESDFAWTDVQCSASSNTLYHRPIWLAGAPDDMQIDRDGKIIDQRWLPDFDRWRAKLAGTPNAPSVYGMKVWAKDTVNSPIVPIIGTDNGANEVFTRPGAVVAGHIAAGDLIFIHGVKGTPRTSRPHGEYQVEEVLADTAQRGGVKIPNWIGPDFIYNKAGYMRLRKRIVVPFTTVFQRAIRSRKKGRPLFLLRGRSRARATR
jgi:hypothetical protein